MKKLITILFSLLFIITVYSQDFTLIHDGLTRTYRLHIPVNYNADSLYPLVINMHGLGSNALEQEFYSAFNDVADSAGFIVVYPNGLDETWNVSSSTGTDDVGFISALIDTVDLGHRLDFERIYATGMSMGGFMSYRLACELSDRIAAIASVTGLQAFFPCTPSRPVPVIHFHGTNDPIVPYAGVPSTINNWLNYNVCPDTPVITDLPDIDTTDNSTVTRSYYGPCDEMSEVILYTINGGEHTWPGATFIIGVTNQDIKASYEIWDFFSKFTILGSTGIHERQGNQPLAFSIYPNPVKDFATVELHDKADHSTMFRIFDMTGMEVVKAVKSNDQRFLIDCSHLPPGIFISSLTTGNNSSYQKIIIQ